MMKHYDCLWVLIFTLVAGASWGYGGGGGSSSKACAKPKFTDFVPAENTEVPAGSAFSFTASPNTFPNTIKVTVKEQPIAIKTAEKNSGDFAVSGTLPALLKGTYARIAIAAEAQGKCKGAGGWLVKISE